MVDKVKKIGHILSDVPKPLPFFPMSYSQYFYIGPIALNLFFYQKA